MEMNKKRRVFEEFSSDYDRWFDDHAEVYSTQLQLLSKAVPSRGFGLEIGIGSGRFAAPLHISCGIDPSFPLALMAKNRGIDIVIGVGEHLPYRKGSFDYALMMTVVCFLEDMCAAFREVYRVLTRSGTIVVGFIEQNGEIYRHYHAEPEKGRFLRYARFSTADAVIRELHNAGFTAVEITTHRHGFCVLTGRRGNSDKPEIP